MKKVLFGALGLSVLLVGNAMAGVVYDTTLASPNGTAADPGPNTPTNNSSWYNGTGNPQGGFTVVTDNGIEIGLRAKYRQSGSVIDTDSNLYTVNAGLQNPTHSLWNYEWSIDLRPDGNGALTFGTPGLSALLTIQDVTTGVSVDVNPLTYWNDNTGFGTPGGLTGPDHTTPQTAAQWSAQQSANLFFADFPLYALGGQAYNPGATDLYRFTLSVSQDNVVLATNTIDVQVAPEPATLGLAGLALVGMATMIRRRKA